jgi:hypothetical protein
MTIDIGLIKPYLLAEAKAHAPRESCGVIQLAGSGLTVVPIPNVSMTEQSFAFEPLRFMEAEPKAGCTSSSR